MVTDDSRDERGLSDNRQLQRWFEEALAESRGLQKLARLPFGRQALALVKSVLRAWGRSPIDRWPDAAQLGLWSYAGQETLTARQGILSSDGRHWLDALPALPRRLAVCHPDWRGVRSTAENLFSYRLFLRDDLTDHRAKIVARQILESETEVVVLHGLPRTYYHLVRALKASRPQTRVMAVWLSNFMQLDEPAEWRGLNDLLDWSLAGEIDKIGFIKRGMAEVFRRRHAPAETLLAYVRQIPTMPSLPRSGGPHLGIWAVEPIWRKLPYAMIAAASLIPNAQIWAVGQSTRASQLAELVNAPFRQISESPIPVEDMPAALAGMHLNLYVTLSECAPMLPLESLAAGTPCLVGPSAPYFDDFPRLYEQIVVTSPDDSAQLFQRIEAALERRADIIQTYSQFAHSYNREAKTQLNRFTGTDAD